MKLLTLFLCLFIFLACSNSDETTNDDTPIINDDDPVVSEELYFPPIDGSTWETESPDNLNWDTTALESLYSFLEDNNTQAFIILKDGKIVVEEYWGETIIGNLEFTENSSWYWASAGKTLTAFLTGIAQQENFLSIEDKTSDHLGLGWSSLTEEQENLITIKNQLTMTTGLDYTVDNIDCTNPECLLYKEDPNTQWYYHNGPYTLLEDVVIAASGITYDDFTKTYVGNKIGITKGQWRLSQEGFNNVYWSTAKDAARFGLLLLNEGTWNEEPILEDKDYFNDMVNSSQNLNPAYGYLTWLNGKSSIIYPGVATSFNLSLSTNAPTDLYAAIGRDGQFIDVIPSKNMVVVRLGGASTDISLVPTNFHDEMWEYINNVMP